MTMILTRLMVVPHAGSPITIGGNSNSPRWAMSIGLGLLSKVNTESGGDRVPANSTIVWIETARRGPLIKIFT